MHLLALPSERTVQREMAPRRAGAGDDPVLMREAVKAYTAEYQVRESAWSSFVASAAEDIAADQPRPQTAPPPPRLTHEVLVMFDEVKLSSNCGFTSTGGIIGGVATTSHDFSSLHDFYRGQAAAQSSRSPADHAMVFCIRSIEAPSLLLPVCYCLQDGTLDGAFVVSTLMAVVSKVQCAGLRVRHILADGASFNLKAFKAILGHGDGALGTSCSPGANDEHRFSVSFANPDIPGKSITVSVCADHTLKRMVRAAYQSHPERPRRFKIPVAAGGSGDSFTWRPLVRVYYDDLKRGQHRRTQLRLIDIKRDGFADLRVRIVLM